MKISNSAPANPIGQRLKLEMKKQGMTSAELAKRANVKTSFLYDIMNGKSANPSTVKLARVAEALGVDLTYLVGGDAAPGRGRAAPHSVPEDYVTVPRIIVEITAGGGTVVSREQEGERYYFRRSWMKEHLGTAPADMRMLHVRGDSMEPTLCHNDIILVDTTKKTPSPPGIFIVFDGGGLVAKRLEFVGSEASRRLRIMSDNPQYLTYERSIDETLIIGRVVWFAREI